MQSLRAPQMQRAAVSSRPSAAARAPMVGARRQVRAAAQLPRWEEVYAYLKNKNLRSVAPEDAESMAKSGEYVIVDVRPQKAYEGASIPGSVNVPLYQALDMSGGQLFQKALKFIAYSANGVAPIEPNPNFVEQAKKAASGKKGLIVVCEAGGTMEPTVNFPLGKASRSLQAAYRCMAEGGADNVMHLARGIYGWYQADLDFNGDYKPEIGRTPNAAETPMVNMAAQARGYEMRPGDKKVEK